MRRDSSTRRALAPHTPRLKAVLAVAAAASITLGCSRHPAERTSHETVGDTLANGLPRALVLRLAGWTQTWRYAIPRFSPDSLARGVTSPFKFGYSWAGAGHINDNVRSRALVDVLSPDSAHSLDFDMYLDLDRGVIDREPDSAPVLADFRSDTVWQVAFCGTSCDYDGAYWVDSGRFALTGTAALGPQADGPQHGFLDVYDLSTRLMRRWAIRAVDDARFTQYVAARDSALLARLEKAKHDAANHEASSRVQLTDSSP